MTRNTLLSLCSAFLYLTTGLLNIAMALDTTPKHTSYKHTHTLELKPMSSVSYQVARAIFLPDYDGSKFSGYKTLDNDYNNLGRCDDKDNLYTTKNCTYPKAVIAASQCPFLPGYYTECKCLPQFKLTSCTPPYILGGISCDNKYEKCVCPATVSLTCPNDKCTSTCNGNCINKTCTPWSSQIDCTNGTQSCDDGCCGSKRKCCIPCTDKITEKPSNSSYTTSKCIDGDGSHAINSGWVCNQGYHEKNGECEPDCNATNCSGFPFSSKPNNANFSTCTITATNCSTDGVKYRIDSCLDGYTLDGGICRAKTCAEKGMKDCNGSCISTSECCGGCGSGEKCSNGTCVAACTANSCSGYTLYSIPSNANYSSCTIVNASDCSTGSTKYKINSCKSGYALNGNSCVVTTGIITIIQKFPDGFSELGGGPWWSTAYKEPGESVYNIQFQKGEIDAKNYAWVTTPMYPYKVKLGGELKLFAGIVEVPSGKYEFCGSSPMPKNYSEYQRDFLYDIPIGNENYTITLTYCKK